MNQVVSDGLKETMASAGNGGPLLVLRALFVTLVLLPVSSSAVSVLTTAAEVKCHLDREYQTDNNICCDKCLPGFKLVEECRGHGLRSTCQRCPEEQFMDEMNFFPNCFKCRRCKENSNQVEESPCTAKTDRVCRCKDGFYKLPISSQGFDCLQCRTCGKNETEVKPCSPEGNTECRCKDNYYRASNKKCLLCTNCSSHPECSALCPEGTRKAQTEDSLPFLINVVAGAAVVVVLALVLVTVVTHFVTKRQTKKKLLSSPQYIESSKTYEELTTHFEEPLVLSLHSPPLQAVSQEPSNLPDCIPLEIKIPDVIYTLLDFVPVLRVKQLVRSLGVSETVIERAELDHRSSREAHYQMLRAWAEQDSPACRGGGGQNGVLHLPLLHELLDKLRLMHLEQTAQELETKYNLL